MKIYIAIFTTWGGGSIVKWLHDCPDFFVAANKAWELLSKPDPEIPDFDELEGEGFDHLRSAKIAEHRHRQAERRSANEAKLCEVTALKVWPF